MTNKISSDEHRGTLPREKGTQQIRETFAQPVINSQECGIKSLAKDTNAL